MGRPPWTWHSHPASPCHVLLSLALHSTHPFLYTFLRFSHFPFHQTNSFSTHNTNAQKRMTKGTHCSKWAWTFFSHFGVNLSWVTGEQRRWEDSIGKKTVTTLHNWRPWQRSHYHNPHDVTHTYMYSQIRNLETKCVILLKIMLQTAKKKTGKWLKESLLFLFSKQQTSSLETC